ncbi:MULTISPECIES: diacylglycerol kinase family protein [Rossellomorea]|uniref:YegS/Rv2252/BmrU family lipid kinase n=1 Tax=Rossellomorea vietnamensis TaxID=218284 RepID=A0A6I6UMT6_9BACI|nr:MULTISPECIES: diacylglycerol kinase family protein [Rossellomorea]MCA0150284.1 diacylglycerol kinase family lipid kinase [Rossellomorea vietnamensis]QHE59870.1 YegS/Rv2252/BmrU family lipid kinase [Rossellomorea vietnamensis]UTE77925.1 diacylglycerol kinase family lipid kinase [Rossellomorea sp. KS-H15a]WGG45904.1 diacylglycerol kinase family lipid kinase [Rossellomorea sp. DA94]
MARFSEVLLICNGKAGQGTLEILLKDAVPPLLDICNELIIHKTKEKGDAERVCRESGSRFELVVIMGGDGTIHEAINGLSVLSDRPLVAILPGGTCNDFARSLRIPMNIGQAVRLITEQPYEQEIDIVKAGERYFSNFWGTGLVAQTSDNIDVGSKSVLGKLSYYISAFQSIQDSPILNVKVTTENEVVEEEVVMLLVANGRSIGSNPLPTCINMDDGLMDIYVVKKSGFPLLKEFLVIKSTGNISEEYDDIMHIQAKEAHIELGQDEKLDMDGELYEGSRQSLRVLHKHLRFVVGTSE